LRVAPIDPRRPATADLADLPLAIRPDGDTALFVGLLNALAECEGLDGSFIARATSGLHEALAAALPWTLERVAHASAIPAQTIALFFQWFTETERTVTVF